MPSGTRSKLLAVAVLAIAVACFGAIIAHAGGGAPTVETEHETSLGRTSVVLNALVNPNGVAVSECYFEYGTSESSLTSTAPCSYSPGELETPVPVHAAVEGLTETTAYFFRIHAKSASGESTGGVREFTMLPTKPATNTEAPSALGHTTATVTAFVTPNDSEVTECWFEYGTVPGELNKRVDCTPAPGAGSEPVAVQGALSGLLESTVYYYRVVAVNSFGSEHGGRSNFETLPSHPRSNTEPAVPVGHTSATLHGFVTPNGAAVESCFFEWGSASIEEHTAPCEPAEPGSGEAPVAVSANVGGLAESTTYHFRLVATNAHGTGTGGGLGFTTLPSLPKTLIQRPVEQSDTSAVVRGRVDPQGQPVTECRFEYGTTPALGHAVPCASLPGSGESYVPVSAQVSGLSPTTAYLVRVRAVNASGTTYSKEETFTTFQEGLLPVVASVKPKKGSAAGGNTVTIKGQNLQGASSVSFGEAASSQITSDTPDVLTVVAPAGVGTVDVVVTTASGESQTGAADRYLYTNPIVATVTPDHGPVGGGTEVTVTGNGFEPGSSGTSFTFGKAAATSVQCESSTTCTIVSPAAAKGRAGTVKVTARVGGKGSKASPGARFTFEH